ncbi:Golgi-associated plant pathogenesis-related protein 1-like [Oculina patagonica]
MLSFRIFVFLAIFYVVMAGYRKDALKQHNALRAIHDAPPMKLKRSLNKDADKYARKLFKIGHLVHSDKESRPGVGENLSMGCTTAKRGEGRSVESAVKAWYDEVCKYNFNRPGYSDAVGHFTQLVWKGSTQLGIGKFTGTKKNEKGKEMTCTYIVARYKKAGNIKGDNFGNNVSKGSFRSSYCDSVGDKSLGTAEYLDAPDSTD